MSERAKAWADAEAVPCRPHADGGVLQGSGATSIEENRTYPPSVQPGIPRLGLVPAGWQRVPLKEVLEPVSRPANIENNANHLTNSVYFQQTCFHSSIGVHVEKFVFKLEDWLEWKFDLPLVDEQRRIADVLDAWNRGIMAIEFVLSAKRRIRRALHSKFFPSPSHADQSAEGWTIVGLGELIASIETGVSVKSEDRQIEDDEIGILKTSSVSGGTFQPPEHKAILANERERVSTHAQRNCTIVSRMNTPGLVGESGYVPDDFQNLFLPDRLWQLKPKEDANGRWLALVVASPTFRQAIGRAATGTSGSMKNISQDALLEIEVARPTPVEQQRLADFFHMGSWHRGRPIVASRSPKTEARPNAETAYWQVAAAVPRPSRAAEDMRC